MASQEIEALSQALARLPGLGPRSARRAVLYLMKKRENALQPLLAALSWFPPFTPFLMTARAGSGPPWWQIAGTLALMFVTAGAVVWLCARAFRAGALSTAKLDPKRLLSSLMQAGRG